MLGRYFRGVCDSIKDLPPHWEGDVETGFPARIKAVRADGVSLWYLPSDEVEHERDRAKGREERLALLAQDMYRAIRAMSGSSQTQSLSERLAEYELRMEALGIEVEE